MKLLTFLSCMLLGSLAMIIGSLWSLVESFKPVKYLAPILLVGFLFTSCNDDPTVNSSDETEFRVKEIDGCEYVYKHFYEGGVMAHKGDCKNPIHEHNH